VFKRSWPALGKSEKALEGTVFLKALIVLLEFIK